jgi:hypothetical protein
MRIIKKIFMWPKTKQNNYFPLWKIIYNILIAPIFFLGGFFICLHGLLFNGIKGCKDSYNRLKNI